MNKIQVYGMQRSGTNFLEYTLRNNFVNLDYDSSIASIGNVKGDEWYRKTQSLKHCLPNTQNGKALIIQRDFEEWDKSVRKKFFRCSYSRADYDYYYTTPIRENWHLDDYLLVNHRWAVQNYEDLLKLISGRFKVEYKADWKQPMKRLHWDGGQTLLNEDFKL